MTPASPPTAPPCWDLFCRVIDNHGDLGVALRLARQLVARGVRVRLWVDDASALSWMAPDLPLASATRTGLPMPSGAPAITVLPWADASDAALLAQLPPAQVWVELFGCELPPEFIAHGVAQASHTGRPVWLNLEYLSAEAYVARSHGLPSPVGSGPARGWTKWFYFPGFTPDTGGLLLAHPAAADRPRVSIDADPSDSPQTLTCNLFCYEPPGLQPLLASLMDSRDWRLRWQVMPGRPARAFAQALEAMGVAVAPPVADDAGWHPLGRSVHQQRQLPHVSQEAFDALLAGADLNFVRGEDSLVSALRAGQPLVWHIYPQDDDAHHDKLRAFLDWLQAPASLVALHLSWNGITSEPPPALTPGHWGDWQACLADAQARLAAQPDLVTGLLDFVARHPAPGD
ncbi:hypothetical protein CCO03_08165 [Comamonas serinivorans]|uniref:Protein-arginine rhamnosyltransferase n=1 Tax=Comamonas serinivorans TaxID=1082851 RepID=A0A1Y0EMV6_9BURK|nr:elongation factor P maturation arginine rhamnosyltransferase EarP [Comamonas serinivorans]ARU04649.1 hypothetical protein CCO03_08165 [Comamonas serinivorans]